MKNVSGSLLVSGVLALGCLLVPAVKPQAQEGVSGGQITVTGDAIVKVVPDEVVITMGVETFHEELSVAKRRNDDQVQSALEAAKRHGVEAKDIQTDFISIEPNYVEGYWRKEVRGYIVRKNIVVTLRDVSRFDDLLTALIEEGVNYVHGIDFRTSDLRKYRDQARSLAITAAKEKAVALARELGRQVGEPETIYEDHSGWWSWYGYGWWGYNGGVMSQNVVQNAGNLPSGFEGSTAPGQISVNARVTVTFTLR